MSALGELAPLWAPLPTRRFEQEFWGRRGVLAHGDVARLGAIAEFAAAFDPVSTILATRRAATVCYPRAWQRGRAPGPVAEDFHSDEAMALFRLGATVTLRGHEDVDPRIEALLLAVRVAVDTATAVVSDLVLGGGEAFAPRSFGTGARFVIGLGGRQRWRTAARLSTVDAPGVETSADVIEAGTVVYVPRGELRLVAAAAGSAVLVVGMPPASVVEPTLRAFMDRMQCEPSLRAPALIPPTRSGRAHARQVADAALAALPRALSGWSADAVLAQRIGPSYTRRPRARARVRERPGGASQFVVHDGVRTRPIEIDASLAPVCRWIASRRRRFTHRQLRLAFALDHELATAVLDTCVACGLLAAQP